MDLKQNLKKDDISNSGHLFSIHDLSLEDIFDHTVERRTKKKFLAESSFIGPSVFHRRFLGMSSVKMKKMSVMRCLFQNNRGVTKQFLKSHKSNVKFEMSHSSFTLLQPSPSSLL